MVDLYNRLEYFIKWKLDFINQVQNCCLALSLQFLRILVKCNKSVNVVSNYSIAGLVDHRDGSLLFYNLTDDPFIEPSFFIDN